MDKMKNNATLLTTQGGLLSDHKPLLTNSIRAKRRAGGKAHCAPASSAVRKKEDDASFLKSNLTNSKAHNHQSPYTVNNQILNALNKSIIEGSLLQTKHKELMSQSKQKNAGSSQRVEESP